MEILFILEPVATIVGILIVLMAIGGFGFYGAGWACLFDLEVVGSEPEGEKVKLFTAMRKVGGRLLLICLISGPIIAPFTQPFEIYKKILIYRGINSETAEKAIDNINALLDLTEKKIKEVSR